MKLRSAPPDSANRSTEPMTITKIVGVFALVLAGLWAMPAGAGQSYRLTVDGLACPFCAYGIEKKLGAVNGVEKLDIGHGRGCDLGDHGR